MRDDVLTIIAGDDKPIKCVYEGDPIVIMGDPLTNGDLTQEYLYGEKYGMGIVLAGGNAGIGRYELAYSKLQNSRQKRRGGQSAQGKAEDAGGLAPAKDDNAAMRTLYPRTFATNSDDCYK